MKRAAYPLILALALITGLLLSWTSLGSRLDNSAYDYIFVLHQLGQAKLAPAESIILAADDDSLQAFGGLLGMRGAFARGLRQIQAVRPRAVALDITLSDAGLNDGELEAAFRSTPQLILPCVLLDGDRWSDPLPRFRRWAVALGQVHTLPDKLDAVVREINLEKATARDRRWALALEAYRVSRHAEIIESPDSLRVGATLIPSRLSGGLNEYRTIFIRYTPGIPRVSLKQLADDPRRAELFRGKVVFAGVTDQTAVQDRYMTPLSNSVPVPGIEIHAQVFESLARQAFLVSARLSLVVLVCVGFTAAAGLIFAFLEGWYSYAAALFILVFAHLLPYVLFTRNIVFPYTPGAATAWLAIVGAAAWQNLVVRKRLVQSEHARERYQQAMHFVTHEMKTPLTAIQGSSELIGRYAMPDEKRKQMADLINTESKRLARMIETFLSAERLSAGQMELKQERFTASQILESCIARVRPLADRKTIEVLSQELPPDLLLGDRELVEYAFYNLLNNAVKYSPEKTRVSVYGSQEKGKIRVTVEDQGIGISPKDVRRIFEKFYRTETAERSAEKGTGIGLSIVEQIVIQHGGSISVASAVGKGSRFTVSLPLASHS